MSAVLVVLLVLYVLLLPEMKVLCFISKGKNCHSIHPPETKLPIFDFRKYQTKEEVSQRTPSNHSQFSVGAILSIIPHFLFFMCLNPANAIIPMSPFSSVQAFTCLDGLKCLHPPVCQSKSICLFCFIVRCCLL